MPCQADIIRRVPVPRPRTSRPPLTSSRLRASVAMVSGDRPTAYAIELPTRAVAVSLAMRVSVTTADRL